MPKERKKRGRYKPKNTNQGGPRSESDKSDSLKYVQLRLIQRQQEETKPVMAPLEFGSVPSPPLAANVLPAVAVTGDFRNDNNVTEPPVPDSPWPASFPSRCSG